MVCLQEVGNDFQKLQQLILLEEFKSSLPVAINTYLEEQKTEAATLADDYKLTPRNTNPDSKVNTLPESPDLMYRATAHP